MKTLIHSLLLTLASFAFLTASAQTPGGQTFTVQEAIQYAIKHKPTVEFARIEVDKAKAQIGEFRSLGLPQITGTLDFGDNLAIQTIFLPAAFVGDPTPGRTIPAQFGVQYTGTAGINAAQLLFDGSYLIGLKAASTFAELSTKKVKQTEIDVADAVTRAYYTVLVTEARMPLLDVNLARLDSVLRQTQAMNREGFVEAIDVQRIEVSRNNLQNEKDRILRLKLLAYQLLKFQMGLPQEESVQLTDKLRDIEIDPKATVAEAKVDYPQRIEYSLLQTQQQLAVLDLKNKRAGYLPRLLLAGRWGYNSGNDDLSELARVNANWFNYSFVGLSVQVPIFDGFRKHYQIKQAKLTIDQTKVGFKELENAIDLQLATSRINLENAREQLKTQQRNRVLAEEVVRVSQIKYREGVGSNIEVVTAEADFRTAETNYFSALYEMIIAQVDLQKAQGTLY